MKKRILHVFIFIGVFFALLCSVGALTAKKPSEIPSENTHLYGTVDETFDFSKIKFKPSSGTENIKGKENLRKIMLSTTYELDDDDLIVLSDDWFTAYCLDQTAGYPENGLAFAFSSGLTDSEKIFNRALLAAIKNDANTSRNLYNLINKFKNAYFSAIEYEVPDEYKTGDTIKYGDMATALYTNSETRINIQIKKITYAKTTGEQVVVTGSEMNEAVGKTGESYEIELQRSNTIFNKFVTTNMDSSVDYNWALWIIEHSYPTLDMDRMLEDIGVSKDLLEQEIVDLEGLTGTDKEEVNKYVENYVYATIQYAIWHVTGSKINGITLGNELIGSDELNKIYKYFILNRDYSNYGQEDFASELTVVKPSSTSEIAEESSSLVKFGPYYISSGMISAGDINIGTSSEEGVSIVDASGESISTVKLGERFYVIVSKGEADKEITINISTDDGYTFVPSTNRGRVYYAHDPLTQTVGTGGIIRQVSANTSLKITAETENVVNPKTGISSVATVFILSLIVFSLGYLLVSYKNKPVEF